MLGSLQRALARPLLRSAAIPAVRPLSHRGLSTLDADWQNQWTDATAELRSDLAFEESADVLRTLLQTGLLTHTDLKDNPSRFFHAHRIVARHAVDHGPGFWIRFTVHYNLYAGSILAVGGDEQVADLVASQAEGKLGCFGLTEKLAGVQSGLVVETTATWDQDSQTFSLHTPSPGAAKNWISQGYTADKAVVMADLIVGGESKGPHAFVMDMRNGDGEVAAGVSMEDMGKKTTGNDLDNAAIVFDNVALPREALLNRFAEVTADGEYEQKIKGMAPFHMIGQRLFSGRIAVAQAALAYSRRLFEVTQQYADGKACYGPGGEHPKLGEIPQLRAIFKEADETLGELDGFVGILEEEIGALIASDAIPSMQLIEAIATAKVKAVEKSIDLCFRLKQEVGSFALMADAGFAHMDFLQCAKFAEGDSRILMSKMARDRLRLEGKGGNGVAAESELCQKISAAMAAEVAAGASQRDAWDSQWVEVYELAELVMERVSGEYA